MSPTSGIDVSVVVGAEVRLRLREECHVAKREGAAAMQQFPSADRRLYNLESAATYLSVKPWTLRHMVYANLLQTVELPSPKSGSGRPLRRLLFDKRELDAFVERARASVA